MRSYGVEQKGLCVLKTSLQKEVYQFLPESDPCGDYGCYWNSKSYYIQEFTEAMQTRVHYESM